MSSPDVVVVGGGLVGLSIAWRASVAGLSATVVDDTPGSGASWVGAGLLAPVTEVTYGEEPHLKLGLESAALYPHFIEELEDATGMDAGYRQNGTLVVAKDADDLAEVEELFRFQRSLGLEVERLLGSQCRELEPMLAPGIRGGLAVPGDHQVDTRALLSALLEACRRSGVVMIEDRAREVLVQEDRTEGVRLSDGRLVSTGAVVVAAGCWSGSLVGIPDGLIPVRPVKGQLIHLEGPADFLTRNLRGSVHGSHVYLVSRGDGRLVIGATVEEVGFDTTITAGAVFGLLRDAYQLLPGVAELRLTATLAGLRPGTPDNGPLIGWTGIEGLLAATGHYRNGILLTPITAQAAVELLRDGAPPAVVEPFGPDRFAVEVTR